MKLPAERHAHLLRVRQRGPCHVDLLVEAEPRDGLSPRTGDGDGDPAARDRSYEHHERTGLPQLYAPRRAGRNLDLRAGRDTSNVDGGDRDAGPCLGDHGCEPGVYLQDPQRLTRAGAGRLRSGERGSEPQRAGENDSPRLRPPPESAPAPHRCPTLARKPFIVNSRRAQPSGTVMFVGVRVSVLARARLELSEERAGREDRELRREREQMLISRDQDGASLLCEREQVVVSGVSGVV